MKLGLAAKAPPRKPFAEVLHSPSMEIGGHRPGVFVCGDDSGVFVCGDDSGARIGSVLIR